MYTFALDDQNTTISIKKQLDNALKSNLREYDLFFCKKGVNKCG